MYLEYDDYLAYGGTLDLATFTDYEIQAETLVDLNTFHRLQEEVEIPERVKRLVYSLVGTIELRRAILSGQTTVGGNSAIVKQTNDGVSTEFNVMSADSILNNSDKTINQLIRTYLDGMKNSKGELLLYRGLYYGK